MKKTYIANSCFETKRIGEKLAKKILEEKPGKRAVVLCLKGDLGSGKTTFLQGFAEGLGIRERVLSPTFVILKKFRITKTKNQSAGWRTKTRYFYHIDCYRIEKPKEILDLGFREIVSNPQNIIAIEWPEKIKRILPKEKIVLKFKFLAENKREIIFC